MREVSVGCKLCYDVYHLVPHEGRFECDYEGTLVRRKNAQLIDNAQSLIVISICNHHAFYGVDVAGLGVRGPEDRTITTPSDFLQ